MVSGTATEVVNFSVAVDRLWKAILDGEKSIPRIFSHVSSAEILAAGDGGVGTIKKYNFTPDVSPFPHLTERIEAIDNDNHVMKYSIIDGWLIGSRLSSASFELRFQQMIGNDKDSGTMATQTMSYETVKDSTDLSDEEKKQIIQGGFMIFRGLESHLIENPHAYT